MKIDAVRQDILGASGHILIQGGPGCGKTTIALLKALEHCPQLLPEQKVLFLSFSRAAVRQISERMAGLIPADSRTLIEVRTFHSFFLDVVRCYSGWITGRPARFITPPTERLMRSDHDGDWAIEARRLAFDEGRFVFDLLAETAALLLRSPRLRALLSDVYPLILVDEFQDTNEWQWQAISALAEASQLACLADPDQRIFDFIEGVSPRRIDDAIELLVPRVFDLSADNHRSPVGGILDYANAVLKNAPPLPVSDHVRTYYYSYETELPDLVHRLVIASLSALDRMTPSPANVAVLATNNPMVGRISDWLSQDHSSTTFAAPPTDHFVHWDEALTAAAGLVVATVLEWPTMDTEHRAVRTLAAAADYYRVKASGGAATARKTAQTIQRAIEAVETGKAPKSKLGKVLVALAHQELALTGDPVRDWQTVRSGLSGSAELTEITRMARLLRLFKATDSLAWNLSSSWDGSKAYRDAAAVVQQVLAAESVDSATIESARVSLMNMHKSKGKEFDGVVIVDGAYSAPLLKPDWTAEDEQARRRLLRVAITRARHLVIFVRKHGSSPLAGP